jgi:phage terminase large subunit-like protein
VKASDGYWSNEFGGARHAAGIGTRVTGDHGHFRLFDDPIKEQLTRIGTPYQIAQAVASSCHFWFGTMGTRAIDHIGCDVIAQQRLHPDDPAGVGVREKGYELISFPAHFDPAHADPRDHRTVAGELLCDRLTEEKCAMIALDIGPTAARAQLEQDPQAPGGQLLKATYMEHRWDTLPAELHDDIAQKRQGPDRLWIIGGDLSLKAKRQAKGRRTPDYVVYELWCAFNGLRYVLDEVRGIWGFREAKAQLAAFAIRHPQASKILLEDAANAAAVEDDIVGGDLAESRDLVSDLLGTDTGPLPDWASCVVLEPVAGGCLARTQAVEGIWASGSVVLPKGQEWVDGPGGFVEEHTRFTGDGTDTDDRVSVSSLVLLHMKAHSGLPAWARAAQAQQQRRR